MTANEAVALEKVLDLNLVYTHINSLREEREPYLGRMLRGQVRYISLQRACSTSRLPGSTDRTAP